jgi:hypothetical protein
MKRLLTTTTFDRDRDYRGKREYARRRDDQNEQ